MVVAILIWFGFVGGFCAEPIRYGMESIVPTRHGPGLQNQPVPPRCASTPTSKYPHAGEPLLLSGDYSSYVASSAMNLPTCNTFVEIPKRITFLASKSHFLLEECSGK